MNFAAAFLLGLAGSLHCAVMCGPLVLAVNAARREAAARTGASFAPGEVARNLAYQGGRLVTYGFLGALAGFIGKAFVLAGFQRWLSIGAGCVILLGSLTSLGARWSGLAARSIFSAKRLFGRLLRNGAFGATTLLGALNGLLPCGLVYVACATSAATASVPAAVATMLAFGLGTLPMLVSIGLAGRLMSLGKPFVLRKAVAASAILVGVLLIVRGLSLGIPYLSPHFAGGQGPSCCHGSL